MKITMIENNPWSEINLGSKRRIDAEILHDIYWFVNTDGRIGLYIMLNEPFVFLEKKINIKGIDLIKVNENNVGRYYLLLKNINDIEIFHSLCNDIITACRSIEDKKIVFVIESRLLKWQHFLKSENNAFPLELQMGLFTELSFVKDYLFSRYSLEDCINGWCGPERDLIDFNLVDHLFEIKSYKSNKGPVITISSPSQLIATDKNLKLGAYGLTITDLGSSILDLYNEITDIILSQEPKSLELFEYKINQYGFFPNIIDIELFNFKIDNFKIYNVTEEFPRIDQEQIKNGIVKLKYGVDLNFCKIFETH